MLQALLHARLPLCLTDPTVADNPIVFANPAFCELTGYDRDEILGRNCRFLQGPETSEHSVARIREIIASQTVSTVEIVNYRKDGTPFINALQLGPIHDDEGNLSLFFGSQLDVSEDRRQQEEQKKLAERELVHRLRNIVTVMSSIVKMTAAEESDVCAFSTKIAGRLVALGETHFSTFSAQEDAPSDIENISRAILTAYAPFGESQFELRGDFTMLPGDLMTPFALVLHELATNAVKHGALSAPGGRVTFSWGTGADSARDMFTLKWVESGGPPVRVPDRHSGSQIITSIATASGGKLVYDWNEAGLVVTAEFPVIL